MKARKIVEMEGVRSMRNKTKKNEMKHKVALSIWAQMMVGFVIPIIFLIVTGVASYSMASKGLQENYETSAYKALQMTMNSFDESMKNISTVTLELAQDSTVNHMRLADMIQIHPGSHRRIRRSVIMLM